MSVCLRPKRHKKGNWCQKTACRADKRASTGKPKASRFTWGYGADMIPLSQICLRPKNGHSVEKIAFSAQKKAIFWQSVPANGQPSR